MINLEFRVQVFVVFLLPDSSSSSSSSSASSISATTPPFTVSLSLCLSLARTDAVGPDVHSCKGPQEEQGSCGPLQWAP